ncbi:hypothetical protein R3P38DRAFT_3138396 [Favolaschia claudopus]|uniref:Uncharacterized protein n=1 Tax=Favolaschia claudopus TaxID=2862362 RepID=A0AAV9Z625_9AGAR
MSSVKFFTDPWPARTTAIWSTVATCVFFASAGVTAGFVVTRNHSGRRRGVAIFAVVILALAAVVSVAFTLRCWRDYKRQRQTTATTLPPISV